ncbi:MAG: cadherin-like beta sandwich domain-containing protein, partial [Bacteroidales bacterium]
MRLKLLLFSLVVSCGFLYAQDDTIRTLIITEARLDAAQNAYVEITNVGDASLNMKDFEFGVVGPWTQPYTPEENYWFMLPDKELGPDESFVMAMVYDFGPEMWLIDPDNYSERITKDEMWTLADIQLHFPEPNGYYPKDSVSENYHAMEVWNGRDCWYIRHHVTETDSVVIDQVGGIFDEENGTSRDAAHDVAGVTNATNEAILVRKYTVQTGNIDFETARGIDLNDSEWMPIPRLFGGWEPDRAVFWTVGNHGPYNLDETTLTSDNVEIDWDNQKLIVPWGVRNDDSLMFQFDRQPGLAWHYHYSENHEDSGYVSARTGDVLTVYACGEDLDIINFVVEVAPPTADANIVVPKRVPGDDGWYGQWAGSPFEVTDGVPGMDSIREVPFGYRTDTLFKYLEKAPNAEWEIVWKDGVEQTAVRTGDILKVTAESGAEKEYYIQVEDYMPSHNAYLSSITWPDIPEYYKDIFGWVGDTIPNYSRTKYEYKVQVPIDVDGIPALVAKKEDLNSKLEITKARSLDGTPEQRTITFKTIAEDDTTINEYKVQLEKEVAPDNKQPWEGEPFISQFIFWEQWNNGFIEFVNPGTEPLDFSEYMIFGQWANDPAEAITWFGEATEEAWNDRYAKYI